MIYSYFICFLFMAPLQELVVKFIMTVYIVDWNGDWAIKLLFHFPLKKAIHINWIASKLEKSFSLRWCWQ